MGIVEGRAYLLVSEPNRTEYVMQYTPAEIAQLFSVAELETLSGGNVLVRDGAGYIDMVKASRRTQA